LGVCSDDDTVTHVEVDEAMGDAEDEGFSGEEPEGLTRQAAGAQPSRNHAKDGHGPRYKICAVGTSDGRLAWR
jgi:hypothetical protein